MSVPVTYGMVFDTVMTVDQAIPFVGAATYTQVLTQELADLLNANGFQVLKIDDSNLAWITGGSLKVKAKVLTNGYGSVSDAASVVKGWADYLGYRVSAFSGAIDPVSGGNSAVTMPNNALNRDTTTGFPSVNEIFGGGGSGAGSSISSSNLLLLGGLALVLVLVMKR